MSGIIAGIDGSSHSAGECPRIRFARLMMGSVSSQVAHHAQCPIVIVPGSSRHQ
jgi:nucleotide-binding universal stress UspA family protein